MSIWEWILVHIFGHKPAVPVPLPPPVHQPPTPPEPPPVVPKPSPVWPNAPGWPVLMDPGTTKAEWTDVLWNDKGLVTFDPDGIRFRYPTGYMAGAAPGTPLKTFPAPVRQVYVGSIMRFSEHWQGHQDSGVSKIHYVFAGDGSIPILMYGPPAGPFYLRMFPQHWGGDPALVHGVPFRADNYGNDAWLKGGYLISNNDPQPVPIGVDFTLEVRIDASVVPSVTSWFLNGALQGYYLGVTYPLPFDCFKAAPVWGGVGGFKTQDDSLLVRRVRIEGR